MISDAIYLSLNLSYFRRMLCLEILSSEGAVHSGMYSQQCQNYHFVDIFLLLQNYNSAFQELESQLLENIELEERLKNEDFGPSCLGRWRKTCWNITEYPETSVAAKVRAP